MFTLYYNWPQFETNCLLLTFCVLHQVVLQGSSGRYDKSRALQVTVCFQKMQLSKDFVSGSDNGECTPPGPSFKRWINQDFPTGSISCRGPWPFPCNFVLSKWKGFELLAFFEEHAYVAECQVMQMAPLRVKVRTLRADRTCGRLMSFHDWTLLVPGCLCFKDVCFLSWQLCLPLWLRGNILRIGLRV